MSTKMGKDDPPRDDMVQDPPEFGSSAFREEIASSSRKRIETLLLDVRAAAAAAQKKVEALEEQLAMLNMDTPTWENTLNTANARYGWQGDAMLVAHTAGYKFYLWNGWVYRAGPSGTSSARICLAHNLK